MLHKNIPYRRYQESKHKKEAVERLKEIDNWTQYNNPFWLGGRKWWYNESARIPMWEREEYIGFWATTPQPCSCMGCGNQRKYEGETRQEIFSYLEMQEELKEIFY